MDDYAKLARALKQPQKNSTTLVGTVQAVNGLTCTVKVADYIYTDVRLRITDDTLADYELRTPKLNSEVVILDLSDGSRTDFVVLLAEQYDKIEFKKGTTTIVIDDKVKVTTPTTTTVIDDKVKVTTATTTTEIGAAVKVKALLTEFEVDATGIKIANAVTNLKPIISNLQQGVLVVYALIGNPTGTAQIAADMVALQTLLK